MKHGKKYLEAAKAVNRANLYDTEEAIALVKKLAVAKFDETIEAHIRTGCRRTSGTCAGPKRLNAQPEIRYCNHGCDQSDCRYQGW